MDRGTLSTTGFSRLYKDCSRLVTFSCRRAKCTAARLPIVACIYGRWPGVVSYVSRFTLCLYLVAVRCTIFYGLDTGLACVAGRAASTPALCRVCGLCTLRQLE